MAGRGEELDRLKRELSEALDRESATSEILRVISSSPTDTQPVFEAIVQSGLKLFPDAAVSVALPEGDQVAAAAVAAADPERAEAWRQRRLPQPTPNVPKHGGSAFLFR